MPIHVEAPSILEKNCAVQSEDLYKVQELLQNGRKVTYLRAYHDFSNTRSSHGIWTKDAYHHQPPSRGILTRDAISSGGTSSTELFCPRRQN